MKSKSTLRIFLAALAILPISPTSARTWKSADGKSTFEGDLIAYSADTGEVTVDRGGKRITFKEQVLSASDKPAYKDKQAPPSGHLSVWLESAKLPPVALGLATKTKP